jgi:hypothetical protein
VTQKKSRDGSIQKIHKKSGNVGKTEPKQKPEIRPYAPHLPGGGKELALTLHLK